MRSPEFREEMGRCGGWGGGGVVDGGIASLFQTRSFVASFAAGLCDFAQVPKSYRRPADQ